MEAKYGLAKPSTVQYTESMTAAETVCAKEDLAVGFNCVLFSKNTAQCKRYLSLFRQKRMTVYDSQ